MLSQIKGVNDCMEFKITLNRHYISENLGHLSHCILKAAVDGMMNHNVIQILLLLSLSVVSTLRAYIKLIIKYYLVCRVYSKI